MSVPVACQKRRRTRAVDGLDEAEHDGDGLPLLPPRVHVICTYRTGTPLPAPEVPVLWVRIGKNDPCNTSDIRAFLTATANGELAQRLGRGVGRCSRLHGLAGLPQWGRVGLPAVRAGGTATMAARLLRRPAAPLAAGAWLGGLPAAAVGHPWDSRRTAALAPWPTA